mmetsp:Transcript_11203/g.31771  ORF Transcript_11203/g.31771 Transcript_11203/m.31771 type:complete len:448 (-) Transcript_11203:16-1359(-)
MYLRGSSDQRPLDVADSLVSYPSALLPMAGGSKPVGLRSSWRSATRRLATPYAFLATLAMVVFATVLVSGTVQQGLVLFGAFWLAAELGFYGIQHWRLHAHNRIRVHPVPHHDPEATFLRFLDLKGHIDIRQFLRGWFHQAEFDKICRENVKDLIYYGFFYVTREEAKGTAVEGSVQEMVKRVEETFDVEFPEGYNPCLKIMIHLWEPLKVHFRPLAFYVVMELLGVMSHLLLLAMGFRQQEENKVVYWTKDPRKQADPRNAGTRGHTSTNARKSTAHTHSQTIHPPPVVFFHGVGFGLLPYLPLLANLCSALPQRRFILVETRHVAMRLCWESTHADEIGHGVAAILEKLKCSSACFVGHSYGTLLMARCLQLHPELCSAAVFLDPVCMLVLHPKLLANFIYNASFQFSPFHKVGDPPPPPPPPLFSLFPVLLLFSPPLPLLLFPS